MVKISMKGFKPVEFKADTLTIKRGGNLNKECTLLSKDLKNGGSAATFVQIRTREPWLTQAVVGKSHRGEMYPGVLTALRERVCTIEQEIRTGQHPSDGDLSHEGADPMDEMEVMEQPEEDSQTRQTPKKQKGFFNKICRIGMME